MSGRIEKKNRSIVVVVETIKQKRLESGLQMAKKNNDFQKNLLISRLGEERCKPSSALVANVWEDWKKIEA